MNTNRRLRAKKKPATSQKRDSSSSESTHCRTCLNTNDLEEIFCSKSDEEKTSKELHLVTGLDIKMNDGLSQKMCSKCVDTFNLILRFRRTCKRAERSLLKMLQDNLRKPKKEYTIEITPRVKANPETDYSFDMGYGDDFTIDDDYDCKEDVKPLITKTKLTPGRKPRLTIPNSSSYKCTTCNKEFRMKATYMAHMRFHTNYCVCESCGKRCRNNNQLQEHKRARHGLGRIHKCAYCEYSSATKEALTIHERRHTGERPYICDHCGASFHRRSNLVQHIAIHLPEKNFQCTFCPHREKSKKRLQIHVSKQHKLRHYSYKCPRCYKCFNRNTHVHRHLIRIHREPREMHPPIERLENSTLPLTQPQSYNSAMLAI